MSSTDSQPAVPVETVNSVAGQLQESTTTQASEEALNELANVLPDETYDTLLQETERLVSQGGLPGMMIVFDSSENGSIGPEDELFRLLGGNEPFSLGNSDPLIGINDELEAARVEEAATTGRINDKDGNVLYDLSIAEQMATIALRENIHTLEAGTNDDDDLWFGGIDATRVYNDEREVFQELLPDAEAIISSFSPNPDGTANSVPFEQLFNSATATQEDIERALANPENLTERQYRALKAVSERFPDMASKDGTAESFSSDDVVALADELGIDVSDPDQKAAINRRQTLADETESDYEETVASSEGGSSDSGSAELDAEGGDLAAEGGDLAAEGGDLAAEGGDLAAEGGDLAAEGGDLAAEGGDLAAEGGAGAAAADSGAAGSNSGADAGSGTSSGSGSGTGGRATLSEVQQRENLIEGIFRESEDGTRLSNLLMGADANGNGIEIGEVQQMIDRYHSNSLPLDQEQIQTLASLELNLSRGERNEEGSPFRDGNMKWDELTEGTQYEGRSFSDLQTSGEFQPMSAEEANEIVPALFEMGSNDMDAWGSLTLNKEGEEPRTSFNRLDVERVLDNPSLYGMSEAQVESLNAVNQRFDDFDDNGDGAVNLDELQGSTGQSKTLDELRAENNIDVAALKGMVEENYRYLEGVAGEDSVITGDEMQAAIDGLPQIPSDGPASEREAAAVEQRELLEYLQNHYGRMSGEDGILSLKEIGEKTGIDIDDKQKQLEEEDKVAQELVQGFLSENETVWNELSSGGPITQDRLEEIISTPATDALTRKYATRLLRNFGDIKGEDDEIDSADVSNYARQHGVTPEMAQAWTELQRDEYGDLPEEEQIDAPANDEDEIETETHSVAAGEPSAYDMVYRILESRGQSTDPQTVWKYLDQISQLNGGPRFADYNGDGWIDQTDVNEYIATEIIEWWSTVQGTDIRIPVE